MLFPQMSCNLSGKILISKDDTLLKQWHRMALSVLIHLRFAVPLTFISTTDSMVYVFNFAQETHKHTQTYTHTTASLLQIWTWSAYMYFIRHKFKVFCESTDLISMNSLVLHLCFCRFASLLEVFLALVCKHALLIHN